MKRHTNGIRVSLDLSEPAACRFKTHPEFRKEDLDGRQHLYTRLAEQIWNPERLSHEAES